MNVICCITLPVCKSDTIRLINKKQCSRQLQCEVPCGIGDVVNSSLFINSSLSSLSSTSHAVYRGSHLWQGGGVCLQQGGFASSGGRGAHRGRGTGDISVQLPLLHYHMVLRPKGTSHNETHKHFTGGRTPLSPYLRLRLGMVEGRRRRGGHEPGRRWDGPGRLRASRRRRERATGRRGEPPAAVRLPAVVL